MKKFWTKLAEAGWRPHAGQLAYLNSEARFRVLACGRRWGKTDAAAAGMAAKIMATPSSTQIAIAPTLAQAKIVFSRVAWMLGIAGVAFTTLASPYPSLRIKDAEANDKNAGFLHILDARSGHEAANLRGQGADHILMDEAAFMPESLITEVAMPMLAADRGNMTLISTPYGRNHFYRYFQMGIRGEGEFWARTGPSDENPKVDKDYLRLQRELLTEAAFAREYLAEFTSSGSTVFGYEFLENAISAPAVEHGWVVVGVDWARMRDYTAVVAVRGTQRQAEVIACEVWNDRPWSWIVEKVMEFATEHKAQLVVCDNTGLGEPVHAMLNEVARGMPTKGIVINAQNKQGFVKQLAWMFEKGRLRLPPDVHLMSELQLYEETETISSVRYRAATGHDDRVVALLLACNELPGGVPARMKGIER